MRTRILIKKNATLLKYTLQKCFDPEILLTTTYDIQLKKRETNKFCKWRDQYLTIRVTHGISSKCLSTYLSINSSMLAGGVCDVISKWKNKSTSIALTLDVIISWFLDQIWVGFYFRLVLSVSNISPNLELWTVRKIAFYFLPIMVWTPPGTILTLMREENFPIYPKSPSPSHIIQYNKI